MSEFGKTICETFGVIIFNGIVGLGLAGYAIATIIMVIHSVISFFSDWSCFMLRYKLRDLGAIAHALFSLVLAAGLVQHFELLMDDKVYGYPVQVKIAALAAAVLVVIISIVGHCSVLYADEL